MVTENGIKAVMHTLLENAFLNVVVNTPVVLSGACKRLFGNGITTKYTEHSDSVNVEVTSREETMLVVFNIIRLSETLNDDNEMKVTSIEVY